MIFIPIYLISTINSTSVHFLESSNDSATINFSESPDDLETIYVLESSDDSTTFYFEINTASLELNFDTLYSSFMNIKWGKHKTLTLFSNNLKNLFDNLICYLENKRCPSNLLLDLKRAFDKFHKKTMLLFKSINLMKETKAIKKCLNQIVLDNIKIIRKNNRKNYGEIMNKINFMNQMVELYDNMQRVHRYNFGIVLLYPLYVLKNFIYVLSIIEEMIE